jgi:hypothetical protein
MHQNQPRMNECVPRRVRFVSILSARLLPRIFVGKTKKSTDLCFSRSCTGIFSAKYLVRVVIVFQMLVGMLETAPAPQRSRDSHCPPPCSHASGYLWIFAPMLINSTQILNPCVELKSRLLS